MTQGFEPLTAALADRYRIEREIGSGGMATVYLAHDVKHDRRVALKVLRPELAAVIGAERFLTEIKTTANLQHPHILALFDSGQVDGTVFYVMPYVEGESLRDRLTREKQLPVPDAVRIATEVASALDYAHRHDVIHRDIKPENILLHDGRALVADFGIALAASRTEGGSRMTETGMSLGTPHYMSPEQAMGERSLDARTDVYALGCVLYEMLTAEPPFTGATAQAIMARVMTEEPRSLTMQRRTVPPHVEAAVRTALEKLPADRFETAALFAAALADTSYAAASSVLGGATGGAGAIGATGALGAAGANVVALPESRAHGLWRRVGTPLAWVAAIAAFGLFARERMRPTPAPAPVARFAIALEPVAVTSVTGQAIGLTPDGARMVYVGRTAGGTQFFSRTMDNMAPVPMPGTEGALSPFFSPDGRHVAFVSGDRLLKMDLSGGPPLAVTDVRGTFFGGSWSEADSILFSDDRGLSLVSAAGGAATLLLVPDSGVAESYRWPEFLPGGKGAVFSVYNGEVDRLVLFHVDARVFERTEVLGANPHYVRQGYLVFTLVDGAAGMSNGTLVAAPFDAKRLRLTGAPAPVAEGVQAGATTRTGKLSVSLSGAVAFASGSFARTKLVAADRSGVIRDLGSPSNLYFFPRLSPDGKRVAVMITDAGTDIWVFDLTSGALSRLTFDRTASRPLWTPDGQRVAHERRGDGSQDIAWIPADGSAPAEPLVVGPGDQTPGEFTPDGRRLVFTEGTPGTARSLSWLSLDSTDARHELLKNAFSNSRPTLSPDGRWMAYVSDESGRNEVYVRPFPGPGGRWQVSTAGGGEPLWSFNGREIFFRSGQKLMTASVQTGASFARGEVRELFDHSWLLSPDHRNYDVTRDGKTFIFAQPEQSSEQSVVVLLNWFDNLKARTPQ